NGVKTVDPSIRVFFGIVGSWSDPARGSELAAKQFDAGADIILSIAGGSGIGVIEEASVRGKYVITVDSNMIHMNPSVILGSFLKHMDLLVKNTIADAKSGTLPFGTSKRVGIAEGMIDYTHDDPNFMSNVPDEIRSELAEWFETIKAEGLPNSNNE
ncbi:MAG: BMP family ABC transporter substrate-binding protein, partial [Kosmotogaceae bacterium]|nr:BMP family ABC transporter substrate-binding protein [Kosmotogaceae bacterium]